MFLFLGGGLILERDSQLAMIDFKGVYCSARCLLEHSDPYDKDQLRRVYLTEGVGRPSDPPAVDQVVTTNVYPPSVFVLALPFAALSYARSYVVWVFLTAASVILASFLIWKESSKPAPAVAGGLIAFFLANSTSLLLVGNPAGIAVSLCAIAVWCFVRGRAVLAGVVSLAISLAIKPQDAGLVWIFFLLAGRPYRRRSIQTLILIIAMCLPVVLWVSFVAPHWIQEQKFNLLHASMDRGINDPRPTSVNMRGIDTPIQLQTVTSIFWDNPRSYNAAAYLLCAPLLLVWAFVTLRARSSSTDVWLALAATAALSLLPLYHRMHDARILLLTVPACTALWTEARTARWFAVLLNVAGSLSIGEVPSLIRLYIAGKVLPHLAGLEGEIAMAILARPVPLIALCTATFYLWISARRMTRPLDYTK